MSYQRWPIMGYRVCLNNIKDRFVPHKVIEELKKLGIKDEWLKMKSNVFEMECFSGYPAPYDCVGEFLCQLDERHVLDYVDDGHGIQYFLYPAVYPWRVHSNDATSEKEAEEIIAEIISKVTDIDPKDFWCYYIDEVGEG